ncbi:TonB-dependent receptor [Gilvimarinus agarilyticus]|uniref:TonB-dependent receptor n=1 Tax=unclassified Gilvimarinus TaxID=2642066 RepID=UPI001C09F020|nr:MULTISPECIES: TonB-dependent receptor [unclassified Gilvimarinus]MBU2886527.1 TonB-dependent receptor [Gilvimarinus agarilyticus]MDO6571195.1 TonB-dependent receptor [Gilvimarinus sp. 2_MG-2023]MDO6746423.1 TonB-dependent receptor [Gilvimarinus sp. 1_MG-2023]
MSNDNKFNLSKAVAAISGAMMTASALTFAQVAVAQEDDAMLEEVVVTGIRASLANALEEKRESTKLVEVIIADDIGKLPDQNLAEVMENITGVQITRTAGVGTGVQIRGTTSNRVEVNGVSTVGSGSGRNGINFEDVNAAMIAAVEVIKSPEAKTIEGSVGGTVNLRTIRPLDLKETLGSIRIQGEDSSLSTEGIKPRISGAYGDNWSTDAGDFGFVISGSYTEQEAVSFRPRVDVDVLVQRDNVAANGVDTTGAPAQWQGVNFLVQEQENDDYETKNIAATFEWAPSDSLKFYTDVVITEQERSRDQYRLQASGIGGLLNFNTPTDYETISYGNLEGQQFPTYDVAVAGDINPVIPANGTFVDKSVNPSDGNFRTSSETGSRVTDSEIFSIGGEWTGDKLTASFELASTTSDTFSPTVSNTMNFLNPNTPLIAPVGSHYYALSDAQRALVMDDFGGNIAGVQNEIAAAYLAAEGTQVDPSSIRIYNDNALPYEYDLSGGSLAFGITEGGMYSPSAAELTDAANYVLDGYEITFDETTNSEDAFRLDFSYELEMFGVNSVDFGVRYNESEHEYGRSQAKSGYSYLDDSPFAANFDDLLVVGPDNFGDADGRSLYISDFMLVDPDASFSNSDYVISRLEEETQAHDSSPSSFVPTFAESGYRKAKEETTALYAQANFEYGIVRGNVGFRYLETDVASTGYGPSGLETFTGGYDFILPRLNLVVQPTEDVLVRIGYGSDISRPSFSQLAVGYTLSDNENTTVALGNPGLEPEEVDSFDIGVEWYFAPSAVVSLGYFEKERTNIFGTTLEGAKLTPVNNGFVRETDPNCPGGGFYNPIVNPNVLGTPGQLGMCVDFSIPGNDPVTTTQSGFEFAFQYDLSNFEDTLGWASGFGVLTNYTMQEFSGGSAVDITTGRGEQVLGSGLELKEGLLEFSENAYNITAYYEKYGLSARLRYTWREAFRSEDFAGGSSTNSTLSFPVVNEDRGQLNASVSYDINDQITVGVEAVNLTEEGVTQRCVSESGPVCFSGYPDRRITFGGSYRF